MRPVHSISAITVSAGFTGHYESPRPTAAEIAVCGVWKSLSGWKKPGGSDMAQERRGETRRFQEQAYANMLTLNALVELLSEKGLLDKQEILDRVKKLQTEMRAKRKPN
jgi:hypothetical protein